MLKTIIDVLRRILQSSNLENIVEKAATASQKYLFESKGVHTIFGSWFNKPITRRQILDSSKLKEFTDDNFKFDENGRKLSKWVENTGGNGEIARYQQFLLFPQCFQKACFPGASKGVIVWQWVKPVQVTRG